MHHAAVSFVDNKLPVPLIAQLGSHHRQRVIDHLLALPAVDRRLRFGLAVNDDAIRAYARGINFTRDSVFGALDNDARLLGLGHLAFTRGRATAEFGVSVLPEARSQGIGLLLLHRAAEHASNRGIRVMEMTFMPENHRLARLAARARMHFVRDPIEPRAYLELPTPSNASVVAEAFEEMAASIDLGVRVANASLADPVATTSV